MREIASAIRIGANAFIEYEYRVLLRVILVVAVVLGIVTMWQAAVALLIGASMSACAGFIGIKIATYANVRVANVARETKDIGKTVKVAFRGGSVMGLCVGGFALLGLFIMYGRHSVLLHTKRRDKHIGDINCNCLWSCKRVLYGVCKCEWIALAPHIQAGWLAECD